MSGRRPLAAGEAPGQVPHREPNAIRPVDHRHMAHHPKPQHAAHKPHGGNKPAPKPREPFSIGQFIKSLGPGLITGASDDDPSGIGTYSQAGAQLGYGIGWTMLLTFPLMAAIQEISARVGRVTGHGISGNVCRHYPAWLLIVVVTLLFIANTINIAADLAAMADATKLLVGGHAIIYVVFYRRDLGRGADLPRLQALRRGAEMADAVAVRLCRRARFRACLLEGGAGRHLAAADQLERRLLHHHRRDPRHHHLALSVLLAGLAGGGRAARRRRRSGR